MFSPGIGLSLSKAARDGKRETLHRDGVQPDQDQRMTVKRWLWQNSVNDAPAWDLITDADPDAYASYAYVGFSTFNWPEVGDQNSYIFNINFNDGVPAVKIVMNPSYGSEAAAEVEVLKCIHPLGRMPAILRQNLNHILVYQGDGTFSSEDRGHFFIAYSDRITLRVSQSKLEDSFFHELIHVTFNYQQSGKGYEFVNSLAWAYACQLDNAYVTEYAGEANQEDLAESALLAYTILYHPERFTDAEREYVQQQIPFRIEFFRRHIFQS